MWGMPKIEVTNIGFFLNLEVSKSCKLLFED